MAVGWQVSQESLIISGPLLEAPPEWGWELCLPSCGDQVEERAEEHEASALV